MADEDDPLVELARIVGSGRPISELLPPLGPEEKKILAGLEAELEGLLWLPPAPEPVPAPPRSEFAPPLHVEPDLQIPVAEAFGEFLQDTAKHPEMISLELEDELVVTLTEQFRK